MLTTPNVHSGFGRETHTKLKTVAGCVDLGLLIMCVRDGQSTDSWTGRVADPTECSQKEDHWPRTLVNSVAYMSPDSEKTEIYHGIHDAPHRVY